MRGEYAEMRVMRAGRRMIQRRGDEFDEAKWEAEEWRSTRCIVSGAVSAVTPVGRGKGQRKGGGGCSSWGGSFLEHARAHRCLCLTPAVARKM
jgi:hypothetical protein